jgi:glycosyltransferase 2 family protein
MSVIPLAKTDKHQDRFIFFFVFKALSIGYMINNLLPAKVGELARMEYIKRKKNISRSFLLGTIFIERLIDLVIVFLFLLVSFVFSDLAKSLSKINISIIGIILFFIALSVFFLSSPEFTLKLTSFLPAKINGFIKKYIYSFTESRKFINNKNVLVRIVIQSVIIWSLTLLSSFLILKGLKVYLPFYGYFFLIAVGVLGLVIPSTSGGIGVFHAIATAALVMLGVKTEIALAYAIISHALDFLPNVFVGLIISFYEGFSIRNYQRSDSHA